IRDRTEPESLLRELDSVLGLTEALRAQAHEFSNRLHTLVGLVELGRYEDAVRFVTAVSISRNELTDVLVNRVHHSMVVALLLAKTTVAAERDVTLILDEKTDLRGRLLEPGEAVTVLGNLVDNAIDAAAGRGGDAWVRVKLATEGDGLLIEVADSGPGIPGTLVSSIFVDGFTTKGSTNGARRGLGLALVQQVVAHRRGTIDVGRGVGAVFSVVLPKCVTEPVGARGQGAEA
ncbi:MAG: sensor histidine kinase, partial [Sciscionella sp.]